MTRTAINKQFDELLAEIAGYHQAPQAELDCETPSDKSQTVLNIDCREGLAELDENSISMVLTDPPYFIDGMSDAWDKETLHKRMRNADVVKGLPVGMKFSTHQSKALHDFMHPIALEWMRVVRPGGFVLCFMQPRLSHAVAGAMEEAGIEIRDLLTWVRNGQAKAFSQLHFIDKRRGLSAAQKKELRRVVGDRKTPQLRPMTETIILGQVPREGTFVDNFVQHGVGLIDTSNPVLEPDSFPSTIMKADKPTKGERHGHITPKPVELLRHLIRIFGGDDPLILDPFAGCGSCGAAAVQEGKNFLGFEIDSTYTHTANKRIKSIRRDIDKSKNQERL